MKLLTKNHSRLVGTFFFLSFLGSFFSISAGLTTEQHSALNKVITLAKNLLPSSSITDAIFCDKAYFIDRFFTENNSIVIGNSTYNQDCLAAMRKNSLKNFLEKCKNIKTKTLSASNQDCNFNVELKEWSNCLDFLFRVFIFNNDQRVFVQIQEKIANIIPQVLRIYQLLNNAFPSGQKNIICFPKSQLDKTNLYRQYSNSLFSSETAKKGFIGSRILTPERMNYVFKATDPICERLGIGVSQEEILKEPCVDIKSKEDFFSENLFIESDGILELQKRLNILAQRRALDNCSTFDDEAKTTVDVLYTFAILQALKKLCTNCALILRMSLPIELAKVTELYAMFFELKEKESNFNIKKEIDMFKGHLSSFAKKVIDKIATLPINTLPVADKSYKQLQIINRICWGIHLDFSDKCNKKSQIDGAYMVGAYGVMAGVVMILSYKTYKLISSLFVNKNKDGQTKTLWESIKEKFSKKKALEV